MSNLTPLLAFPVWLDQSRANLSEKGDISRAMDLFALLSLGFLFFVLGVLAAYAWMIWRRNVTPTPHEQLLMELHHHDDEDPTPANDRPAPKTEPWEKPSDWWQKAQD